MSPSLFKTYSLDACVLLAAYNATYTFDLFPSWWQWIESMIAQDRIFLCQETFLEIVKGDEIHEWAKKQKKQHPRFVREAGENEIRRVQQITQRFDRLVLSKNAREGDPHVIAHAMEENAIVVTEEKSINSPEPRKIPDVCKALGVKCINTVEFMRREGVSF